MPPLFRRIIECLNSSSKLGKSLIKFKFLGFFISFLTAILVITNGNGSLFQNAFGDSDSDLLENSVDEIVESAEDEGDQAREEAEDTAEEATEDSDDEVRDRDNDEDEDEDEDEDKEEDTDNGDDSSDETSLINKFASDPGEDGEDGKAGPTGIGKDESEVPSGLGEGSGMQIFVSPRERVNEILDQHLDNIEDQVNIQEDFAFHPAPTPGGVGASPDEIAELIAALIQDTGDITEDTVAAIIAAGVVADGQSELIADSLANRVGASPGVIDLGPCDGGGLELISGTGLCNIDAVLANPSPDISFGDFFEIMLPDVPGGLQGTSPISDTIGRGGEDIYPWCCVDVIDLFDVDIPQLR